MTYSWTGKRKTATPPPFLCTLILVSPIKLKLGEADSIRSAALLKLRLCLIIKSLFKSDLPAKDLTRAGVTHRHNNFAGEQATAKKTSPTII